MASLNTLRTRGGIIVSVVIGLALIAFLLGDFLSSGQGLMNARKMKVGEIYGAKIGYIEYSNLAELFTTVAQDMSGRNALSAEEQDATRNMAWESLIMKYAYQPGFEDMGINVSEAEQVDMASGVYLSPILTSTFVNPQTRTFDPAWLRGFVENLGADQTGRAQMMWNYLKDQMNNQREMSKYVTLVAKGMYVNDLEVQAGMAAENKVYGARIVSQDYAQIPDSTVTASNSDIKDYYASHKNMFRQSASRDIEYVVFDLLPSKEDYAEAEKYINTIASEFAASETPMQYATLNSQEAPNKRFVSESEIDGAIAAALIGKPGAMYGPVLNGETYTLARIADTKNLPDSIGAKHILLPAGETERADSLVAALKAGADFGQLALQYSLDQNAANNGGDLGVFSPDQMIPEFSEACMKANKGDIFTANTQYGIHVVQLTYKSPLTPKVQLATITYLVEPSSFTQQSVYADASKFIASAAGSYDNFKKATTESALSKRVARIRNTDRNVSGINDSRELVRWAFNGEKGDVSGIMELGGNYVVAALTEVREDGIAPLEQVAGDIRSILVREKKGAMLAEKMAGSSLDEVASKLGTAVIDVKDLQFGAFYLEGIGVEPKLIGAICGGAKPNTLSKPVTGLAGVYLFDVNNVAQVENATLESERVKLEAMSTAYIAERLSQALVEASDVKDMRVKFF